MITGFNTDIKHGERVFHVQTEDRGVGNPVVESLVYVGGEILLSKKSPYAEHVKDGRVDEKAVRDLMDWQHRRVIEAIRRGRLDAAKPGGHAEITDRLPAEPPAVSAAAAAATAAMLASRSGQMAPVPARPVSAAKAPARAPAASGDRTLDQVIMDYLASEAASEHLEIGLVRSGELVSGESVSLTVRAKTSLTEKPVAGAHVSIRVVSTQQPPQVLYRGVTGNDGLMKTTLAMPDIGDGHAALIVAASSALGSNEIKHFIRRAPKAPLAG